MIKYKLATLKLNIFKFHFKNAPDLLATPPSIEKLDILAAK